MTRKKEKDFDKRLKDTAGRQPRRRKTDNKKVEGAQKKPKRVKVSFSTDGCAFQDLGIASLNDIFWRVKERVAQQMLDEAIAMPTLSQIAAEKEQSTSRLSEEDCVRIYSQALAELELPRCLALPPEERAAFVNDVLARAGLPGEFMGGVHDSMSIHVTNEQMREYAEAKQEEEPAKEDPRKTLLDRLLDMLPEAETPEAPGYILQGMDYGPCPSGGMSMQNIPRHENTPGFTCGGRIRYSKPNTEEVPKQEEPTGRREDFGKGPVWDERREQHARAMAEDLTQAYDKNHELERDLAGVIDKCMALEEALGESNAKNVKLDGWLASMRVKFNAASEKNEVLEIENQKAKQENARLQRELDVLKTYMNAVGLQFGQGVEANSYVGGLCRRLDELQNELTEVKRENTLLVQKEAGWERRVRTLREIIGEREQTIEAQRGTLTAERMTMQKLQAAHIALKQQLVHFNQAHAYLKQ